MNANRYDWSDFEDFRQAELPSAESQSQLELEWGESLARRRRKRYKPSSSCWATTVVAVSTVAALGIATLVGLTLTKSPLLPKRSDPTEANEMGSLLLPTATQVPSHLPSPRPSTPPTSVESQAPSSMDSGVPSLTSSPPPSSATPTTSKPTEVLKAPPAPIVYCIDEPGFFHNHAGDKVSCDWFQTVGTYNYEKNCERTSLGKACLESCQDYNDCKPISAAPSEAPSSVPSVISEVPSLSPIETPPNTITIGAAADATIKESSPEANLGSASMLKLASSPESDEMSAGAFHILLRFDLTKHDSLRSVESAVLRLNSLKDCISGGSIQQTDSPHWNEDEISWMSAPEGSGEELSGLGQIKSGFWYEADISEALRHGHQGLSLRIYPSGSEECFYRSKEDEDGPELRIVYAS